LKAAPPIKFRTGKKINRMSDHMSYKL